MRIDIVAFTRRGAQLAQRLADGLEAAGHTCRISVPPSLAEVLCAPHVLPYVSLHRWTEQAFATSDALLFVSACGIAVRAITPFVRDKLTDPAVVCLDEAGTFAIPLLSGHVGGANALARTLATLCGAQAVITTATDVNGLFAIDEWAARQGLCLLERSAAKAFSAELLAGNAVGIASDFPIAGNPPAGVLIGTGATRCSVGACISYDRGCTPFVRTLHLVPRTVTVGIGCRRNTEASRIEQLVDACLREAHIAPEALCTVASIDVKADEPGLLAFAQAHGLPLRLYTAQQLAAVEGHFASSDFVRQTVGVDNVCERAACAKGASLVLGRRSAEGVTVALATVHPQLSFDCDAEGGRTCI